MLFIFNINEEKIQKVHISLLRSLRPSNGWSCYWSFNCRRRPRLTSHLHFAGHHHHHHHHHHRHHHYHHHHHHYDHHDRNQVIVETFPLRLADDSWHRLAVMVSGDQIEVKTIISFITIVIITITLLECWVFKVWKSKGAGIGAWFPNPLSDTCQSGNPTKELGQNKSARQGSWL